MNVEGAGQVIRDTKEAYKSALRHLREEGRSWSKRRDTIIREASLAGLSLRDIGGEVGLSPTGVQKIVNATRVQDGAGQ
jgi:phage terminase small subunit